VLELEKTHAPRRELVWAELGESPLALAIKHLHAGCGCDQDASGGGLGCGLASRLCHAGLARRRCVLSALACVDKPSMLMR
jgi:hypothetical protein